MYEQVLQQMRYAVKIGRVRLTTHALDELEEDGLQIADALHCILTGEIVEDQYDERYQQMKYVFYGDAKNGGEIGLIARWDHLPAIVVITVYRLRIDDYD
jgi:Domain of unknown function (DUF4258)